MKRYLVLAISIPIALFCASLGARDAFALDAPHNTNDQSWSITCTRCHYSPTGPAPAWATLPTTTDDTFKNNLCKDCHSASGMPLADPRYTNVKTHSAAQTGSSYWGGNWSVECVICHSPHYQQQATNAAYSAETGVNVVTGITSTIATSVGALSSSLTDAAAAFPANGYIGYLLVPNVVYPTRVYRITANDATTITVDGAINLNYAAAGTTYGIRYGKMVNVNVLTPNSGVKQVKFFNATGPNSFGSGVNAVCQVCHTQTASFRNDGTREAGSHPPGVAETQACTDCHSHADGFKKGGCTGCHGDPPVNGATLIFADKSGTPVASDSPGAGAHLKHTTTASLTCVNCHTGGMLAGAAAGDDLINIGFQLGGSNLGGTYDGKSGRTVYPYAGGGTTSVTTGNSLQCSNIYCHSTGQSLDGSSATPVYASPPPAWTTPASGACGTCHGTSAVTLTTGGHSVHLSASAGCGDCHIGAANDASSYASANHANRSIDVANDYNMGGSPGNGYGTCATAACHQTGITPDDLVVTPVWNVNAPNCTVCHANVPATGAHSTHVTSMAYDCSQCHTNAIKDTSYASAEHRDLNIDVAVGGYPANKSIGSAKQSCAITCHGSKSPVWDDLSGTTGDCSLCHGMAASTTDVRNTNGDTSAVDPRVGAHYAHLNAVSVYSSPVSCTDCHTVPAGATYTDKVKAAGHIDGDNRAEVLFSGLSTTNAAAASYDYGTGTCSNVYCHGGKMIYLSTNGSDTRPEWAQDTYLNSTPAKAGDCGVCHGAPPNTASHSGSEPLSACTGCHDHVNSAGSFNNKALHMDGMVQAAGCTGCHGQPPVDAGTMVNTTLTGRTTLFPASNGGAGAHDLHVNSKSIGCNRCHNTGGDSGHQTRLQITFGFTYGLNGGLYQAPTFSNGFGLRSDGTTTVQVTGAVRQCSNIYCHSSGQAANGQPGNPVFATANWDVPSSGACGACHKTTTGTALGRMDTGSHPKHLDASAICGDCHTGAGTGIAGSPDYTDNASHLNQLIDVASGLTYTGSGAPGNGYATCTTASCHDNGRGVSVPSPQWGSTVPACTACHALQPGTGSHPKHLVNTQYAKPVCGDCHDGAVQGTTAPVTHLTGSVEVYDAAAGDLGYPTVAKHNDANYQSCTTAYCHSTGQSLSSGTSATPVYSSVTWSTTVSCGGCHAATKAAVSAANSGSHALHLNNAAVSGCGDCHTGAANDGSSYNSTSHVNRTIDVASGLNYPLAGTPGNGYGRCSAMTCHGSQSPVWGTNTTANQCTKCHGTPTAGASVAEYLMAPPQDTNLQTAATDSQVGAHQAHLTTSNYRGPIACSSCHVVPGTAAAAGHIDSLLPAELIFSGLSTTYHSVSAPTPSYNYSTGTCLTTYCHDGAYIKNGSAWSNGTGTAPVWTNTAYLNLTPTAADCGRCHGYPPGGTHDASTNCSGCHDNVRSSDNLGFTPAGLALHMDGSLHGGGDACTDCHGGILSSGLHSAHTSTTILSGKLLSAGDYGKLTWWYTYSTSGGVPNAGCGYCHPQSDATHRNGSKNLNTLPNDTGAAGTLKELNAASESYPGYVSGSNVVCASVYCHSNGYSPSGDGAANHDYTYVSSPNWYGAGYPADGTKCASCHTNSPSGSSAHSGHAVGIHYADVFTGTTGKATMGTGNTNAHGNALYSTTINCNVCHSGTVTVSYNDKNTLCATCHNGSTATLRGNMAVDPASTLHVNGTPDIVLAALTNTLRSKAQLRSAPSPIWSRVTGYKVAGAYDQASLASANYASGTKTCTTACHFSNPVQWGATISCMDCHTSLP